ncbi:MAG: hypothetical protein ACE5FY_00235 [Nitrospiria bacterium]
MKVNRGTHLKIAFAMWGIVGTVLFVKGLGLLYENRSLSTLTAVKPPPGIEEGIALAIGLAIGFIKGFFVLTKLAKKNIARINTLPEVSPFYMTFNTKSWFLILGMMALGYIIKILETPHLIHGAIDIAVGLALALGCRAYLISSPTSSPKKEVLL